MKVVRFARADGSPALGVLQGDEIADLSAVAPTIEQVTELFDEGTRAAADQALPRAPRLALATVQLLAPLPRPRIVFAVGVNYRDHAAETGRSIPDFPVVFNKQVSCITGPFDAIHYPSVAERLDYEGELAFLIGRRVRHVRPGDGLAAIGGYTVMNDVTVRDWQAKSPTWTLGKSFDTHGPMGPCVVTADEIGDPHRLALRTWVNGELRQESSTDQLIFDCGRLVEILSTVCTLEPGDVVSTGTPGGVGVAMDPPGLLAVGDVVRVEIEGIGHIENRVVAEPAPDRT